MGAGLFTRLAYCILPKLLQGEALASSPNAVCAAMWALSCGGQQGWTAELVSALSWGERLETAEFAGVISRRFADTVTFEKTGALAKHARWFRPICKTTWEQQLPEAIQKMICNHLEVAHEPLRLRQTSVNMAHLNVGFPIDCFTALDLRDMLMRILGCAGARVARQHGWGQHRRYLTA